MAENSRVVLVHQLVSNLHASLIGTYRARQRRDPMLTWHHRAKSARSFLVSEASKNVKLYENDTRFFIG